MVDIEQRALGPLEEDTPTGGEGLVEVRGGVGHKRCQPRRVLAVLAVDRIGIERFRLGIECLQHAILVPDNRLDPVSK